MFANSSIVQLGRRGLRLHSVTGDCGLHKFSFHRFLGLRANVGFQTCDLRRVLDARRRVTGKILSGMHPLSCFRSCLRRKFCPFFLRGHGFSRGLLGAVGVVIRMSVLLVGRVRLGCLSGVGGLLCLLTISNPGTPGIDRLTDSVRASHTAIVGCVGCLTSTHLVGLICPGKRRFPGGPSGVVVRGSGLVCSVCPMGIRRRSMLRAFFTGSL